MSILKNPIVIVALLVLAAGLTWYYYDTRPLAGTVGKGELDTSAIISIAGAVISLLTALFGMVTKYLDYKMKRLEMQQK